MTTENEKDELIFDFLEGNLNAAEEEAFLILQEESELFNRQVRLWQNTYMHEPLPAIKNLESKLFINTGNHTTSYTTRIYIIFIVMLTSVMFSHDHARQHHADLK